MTEFATREELEYKLQPLQKDIDNLATAHREHKQEVRDDFHNVWKAIDGMIVKVGVVVSIIVGGITFLFKLIEVATNR